MCIRDSYESIAKRETAVGVAMLIAAAGTTIASTWAFVQGGWWYAVLALTVPLTLVFMYGTFESFTKVPRDEKGNRKEVEGSNPEPPTTRTDDGEDTGSVS